MKGHDEEAHQMIEEALASIRLYHRFGAAPLAAQQVHCVTYILKKAGENRHSRILTEAADAVSRAYGDGQQGAPDAPPYVFLLAEVKIPGWSNTSRKRERAARFPI